MLADVRQDALLELVELRRRLPEVLPTRAVRQEPVVQLVRRPDALALHRLRHPVCAVREHAIHRASRAVFAVGAWSSRSAARQSPTLPAETGDLRLLPLPGRAAAARGARARAGLGGTLRAPRVGSARRARIRRPPQPRATAAGGVGAAGGCGAEARPRERRRVRRRLRDSALVAPPAQPGRRRALDGRHRGHPADAPRAGACRPHAVRLRRRSACPSGSRSSVPARMERLYARALGAAAAIVTYSAHEADVDHALAPGAGIGRTCRSSCPFGVDVEAFRPTRRAVPISTSSPSEPTRIATSSCSSVGTGVARDELPRRDDGGPRALARRPAGQPLGRDGLAVRRDAPAPRASARRRPSRPRQQLLGGDDGAPPGDGARQAGRRHPDGGDRDGLRARGRRQRAARRLRGTAAPSAERWPSCSATGAGRGRSACVPARPSRGR